MLARMLLIVAAVLAAAAPARAQDTLTLLRTARVEPGRAVVLGDVARLEGPSAERLATLVLVESPEAQTVNARGWFQIGVDEVRTALEAELGEGAGIIAISGKTCDVRVIAPLGAGAAKSEDREATPAAAPDAASLVGLSTVRGGIAREIVRLLQVAPGELRLAFEADDAAFLDTEVGGRVLEVKAIGSSERMPMGVRLYEANGRAERRTIRVGVQMLRRVAVVSRVLPRGAAIGPEDLVAERRWVLPTDRVVEPDLVVGAVAKQRLDPGDLIAAHLIQPQLMIRRGDPVQVSMLCGQLIIRRKASAMADGREGEVIEFAGAANPRERFKALVVGKGQATIGFVDPTGTPVASGETAR